MLQVLRKLNLENVASKFELEKITPDIICKLSSPEFNMLGISNTRDMMKLRTECVKFASAQCGVVTDASGAPQFNIPRTVLESLIENGFIISDIAKLLSVSESTIFRRMRKYGLSKRTFCDIPDGQLDLLLAEVIKEYPNSGENMLNQMLVAKGVRVQRWRLRECIHRIDNDGSQGRRRGVLHRRVYNVGGPNHLWHIDTNHKLVRWRFIIIGGIDGFSRMITFLKCADNNTADTVLQCFLTGVTAYGIPKRVRSDKGRENVGVADFMISRRGRYGMLTGKSTHNQRIERLWRDVFEGVLSYFYHLFYHMEDIGILDPLNPKHLAALHYIFLDEINRKLDFWTQAWGSHRIRTVKASPIHLWTSGQLQNLTGADNENLEDYGVEGFVDGFDGDEDGRPIFESLVSTLGEHSIHILNRDLIRNHTNYGIDDFRQCLRILDSIDR
ncbi:hypothetical protein FSP39_012900 [Pinctada imbricata]|nr:hypothetical protein FSP39_012900 [Pinctada imbricata]